MNCEMIIKNTFIAYESERPLFRKWASSPHIEITGEMKRCSLTLSEASTRISESSPTPPPATGRLVRFAKQKDRKDTSEYTTVMIRNIPCRYVQEWLIQDITEISEQFNFVYLPPVKRGEGNVGYAFVNFATPDAARLFMDKFQGFSFPRQPNSSKCAEVVYAVLQGLKENIKFYKNSKVRKTENRPYINRLLC